MNWTDAQSRARWSYETGRLRLALPGIATAAALVIFVLSRPHPTAALSLGVALLMTATVAGLWRRAAAKAVPIGIAAGLVPFFAPYVAMRAGLGCGLRDCTALCLTTCLFGGLLAGAVIVRRSRAVGRSRRTFLAVAGGVGALAGGLGCLEFGIFGLVLLVGGFAVALSPSWVVSRATVESS